MKYNNEIFIKKANIIHVNKYNYSLVDYVDSQSKIKIICKNHGIFEQIPASHLKGFGCSKCGGENIRKSKVLSINNFIDRANVKYDNKYDYSLVKYYNSKTEINIICKLHGRFNTTPERHLKGIGCPICSGNKLNKNILLDRFKIIHGDKYDYSLVNYISTSGFISIICREHGLYKQRASHHLNGDGCPKCAINFNANNRKLNTEKFIEKAKIIQGNKYDYSLVNYIHSQKKVNIICDKHGIFKQLPNKHLLGSGCPLCSESKGEKKIREILNEFNIIFISQKTFEECRGSKHKLPFDFYLPDKNILIEFNGEQHYETIKYFGGVDSLNKIKKTDEIKRIFAKKNNILLIEIKYNDFNNIKTILINEKII